MNKLMEKMLKASSVTATLLSESDLFDESDFFATDLPILNIAFSGKVTGGINPGITVLAGESKTFKSALSLYCMKAYLNKYDDAIGILYDTEFGITPDYIKSFGIDPSRVLHIPVDHIEQLKFDFTKKLEELKKGDRVFFLVDSIGQISSKKEVEDAHDEKSVADMTRAKAMRSLLRLVTSQLSKKKLPCFLVSHIYMELGLYPKIIIPNGQSVTLSANTIFVISKSQEKDSDGDLSGWNFNLTVHKSRVTREKSRLTFTVHYDTGIQKYSGLMDIALETGHVIKPNNGWYSRVNTVTGEVEAKKWRMKDAFSDEFWLTVLNDKTFQLKVEQTYKLTNMTPITDDEIDNQLVENENAIQR